MKLESGIRELESGIGINDLVQGIYEKGKWENKVWKI